MNYKASRAENKNSGLGYRLTRGKCRTLELRKRLRQRQAEALGDDFQVDERDVPLAALHVGEALSLEWSDIRLEPVSGAPYGFLHVRDGKTRNAKRNVPLTVRVRAMLEARQKEGKAAWVFTDQPGSGPLSRFTVRDQHDALRRALRFPGDAVIHSLRHTMLTRLGEAGVDAFTIMRIAGHSTITVSQKYVHPSREAIGLAIQRLEAANRGLSESPLEGPKRQLPATVSATPSEATPALVQNDG